MNRLFIILLIACFSIVYPVNNLYSQSYSIYNSADMIEQMLSDEEGEERSVENYIEELNELYNNPVDINIVTKEQLELFPFLTDTQIENILYYVYAYGPMKTIYELQLVEDMDWQTLQYLRPFVYADKVVRKKELPSLNQIMKYGKQELITRFDIPLYKRAGYKDYPDSILLDNPNKRYSGSSFYHSLRYGFRYKDRIYFGVTAEKDAGEPFFAYKNKKGYDYYSFYFLLRDIGNIKTLALGNYRLNFGLGLVMNTDYSLGKTSSLSTIGYKPSGIRKHSSTDEYNYFRGIAMAYQIKRFTLSAFYSHRDVDAIVNNEFITSFKKDGMHRTFRDFERKNKAVIQLIGSNLTYQSPKLRMGLTGVYNFFNKMFIPEVNPYSVFNLKGQYFFNLGIDYRYRWRRITFFGETAMDKHGNLATLNVLRFSPLSGYHLLFLQRYYAIEYNSLYARSVSEGSSVQNENGWYIGFEANPIKHWKLIAYGDFFRFPWLKYGVDHPSSGFDGSIQVTYSPKQNLSMFGRYKYKVKDKNYKDEEKNMRSVIPYHQHRFRYQINYSANQTLSFRTTVDFNSLHYEDKSMVNGFMLSQSISYKFVSLPFQIDMSYNMFDTDAYESRLSIYEKGLLYSFSVPSFYGKGVRSALNIRYDLNKRFMILTKIAQTRYFDREEISSGLEMIEGNKKTDLYVQLRCKF